MHLVIGKLNIEGLDEVTNIATAQRIESILKSWEGTRYLSGCQAKQVGVDCVRFVSGVLDELFGTKTILERLPRDIAFRDNDKCFSALRAFMERYEYVKIADGNLQPGDVVMVGPLAGGPGHALITGSRHLWQCGTFKVERTGTAFPIGESFYFKKAIRGTNRERWA